MMYFAGIGKTAARRRQDDEKDRKTDAGSPRSAMANPASSEESPLPLGAPMLLSFVAGYVDSYTYLALFGLFAAQVTGSFVIAGAEFIRHDYGIVGKLLAIVAFIAAAAVTTALIMLV